MIEDLAQIAALIFSKSKIENIAQESASPPTHHPPNQRTLKCSAHRPKQLLLESDPAIADQNVVFYASSNALYHQNT
jgi:hypothetical protein